MRKRGFSDSSMQLEAGLRTEADETPQPPCCLARCWCCDKSSLRISGGSGRDTCLEVHKLLRVAVTIHRAQGSPSHSHADSLGGLGLDCLPRTHVRARDWGTGDLQAIAGALGKALDSALLWSGALFYLTSI